MRDLVREAALKSSATGGGEKLERGPHSLVALLQTAYLTTDHLIHRMRFKERPIPPAPVPPRFLKPLVIPRRRRLRRSARS